MFLKDDNIKKDKFYTLKDIFLYKLKNILGFKKNVIDLSILDDIENHLLSCDIGYDITNRIIEYIKKYLMYNKKNMDINSLYNIVKNYLTSILNNFYNDKKYDYLNNNVLFFNKIKISRKPYVFIFVGINGAGKTTTLAKMNYLLKKKDISTVIAAADTFRAAAIDQLDFWANKFNTHIIKEDIGCDAGAVVFKTLEYAIYNNIDVVLIDTAGRLHNNINLMNELLKIIKIIKNKIYVIPQDIVLVMDASIGYNSIRQVEKFKNILNVNSIIINKLDSYAKGGMIVTIIDKFKIPINFVGYGENILDFNFFNKDRFINSFF